MKVFEVNTALKVQSVMSATSGGLLEICDRVGKPVGQFEFPSFYISTPKNDAKNFFNMDYGFLLFDIAAKNALGSIVEVAGEVFEIEVEELGLLTALNVCEHCESALDHELSAWSYSHDGMKLGLQKYAFIADNVTTNSGLFRIPENRYSKTLAVTGGPKQKGDFYTRYHEAGLTGLDFQLLWSDEK